MMLLQVLQRSHSRHCSSYTLIAVCGHYGKQ
jgi:hypothetical protein